MSLGVAVIGCGMIGALRAQAVSRTQGATLRLVCDVDGDRARALGARYRCAAERDWAQAIARDDVQVVVVSTPNDSHAEIVQAAATAGKHVLCEKPLARTPEECRRMVDAAATHRVKLMTGFSHRQFPPMVRAAELLQEGAIGTPLSLRGWIGHEAGAEFRARWMRDVRVSGGGTLLDNGVHLIDLVRALLGEVSLVQGSVQTSHPDVAPCEDQAMALLHMQSGALAWVMSSWTEWRGYRLWLQIHGTSGVVTAQYPPMLTVLDQVRDGRGRAARSWHVFPVDQVLERMRSWRWTLTRSLQHEIHELLAAVREDREPRPSGYDGLRAVEVVHAVYESSKTGAAVPLPLPGPR